MPLCGLSAQTIPSPYRFIDERQELGIFAGYLTAATGRFGYGPSGGPWVGARYGIELAGPLSFEAVAGAILGERDIISPGRPEGDRAIGQGDAIIGTIDGRLKLSATGRRAWHGMSPFIVLGAGVAFDPTQSPDAELFLEPDEVFDFGPTFFGTAGFGTRWFVTRKFGLRADALFSLWRLGTPVGFGNPEFEFGPVDEKEWVRGLSLTTSLLYRW